MIEYHSVIDITSSLPESKNLCAGVFIDVHLLVVPHRCHDVVIFVPKFVMRAISTAHIILNGYTTQIYLMIESSFIKRAMFHEREREITR